MYPPSCLVTVPHVDHAGTLTMDATWRNAPLVNASGALSAAGAAFLQHEAAEERVAVVTFTGPAATQAARVALVADLLEQPGAATAAAAVAAQHTVTLLASVACAEEDVTLVLLDATTSERHDDSNTQGIVAVVCALSSLVVSCCDNVGPSSARSPLRALLRDLSADLSTVELFELMPRSLTIDLSPDEALAAVNSAFLGRPRRQSSSAGLSTDVELDELLWLRTTAGAVPQREVAQTGFLPFFLPRAPPKKMLGTELTGDMLHLLLQAVVQQAMNDEAPDLGSAWDELVERRCNAVAEDAMSTYVDCIHSSAVESPPMELDAFAKLHSEIWRLSMDVFHTSVAFKSNRRRVVRRKLKDDIAARYDQELALLRSNSRDFCQALRESLWARLSDDVFDSTRTAGGGSFDAMLRAVQEFDEQYNERARGPEKQAVLRDFYRHEAVYAFQQLEGIVSQQLSDAHLRDLRLQLERDFADKKQALVDHFKTQEAQLRASVAQELDMARKLQQAKSSRAKIDEGESRRVRDELAVCSQAKTELEAQLVVLEHAQQDAASQRAALERKVDELELSVRHEMSSRAELVDTLAVTIKAAEEKERTLNDKIHDLQVEVGEKTFRVEGELNDLALQLRKTNEVGNWNRRIVDERRSLTFLHGCRKKRSYRRS